MNLLVKSFGCLEHVTNLYAMYGFVFLVIVISVGVFIKNNVTKGILLGIVCCLALFSAYLLLDGTVKDIEKGVMLHLVRGNPSVEVTSNIRIELLDVETLKGKKSWEFNSALDDYDHVIKEIFIRSNADLKILGEMNSDRWKKYLESLEDAEDTQTNIVAERIKDIPFAKYRIFINGVANERFQNKYYFKGEIFCIPYSSGECTEISVQVENIYNTKHYSSGEPEASNVRILRK